MEIPKFVAGNPVSASALEVLRQEVERLKKIRTAAPLVMNQDAAGITIGLNQSPPFRYATMTAQADAYNATTRVYGKGAGTLEVEDYSAAGVCTGALTSPAITIDIYNGGKDPIVVGRRVGIYEKVPGRWHAILDFCP